MIDVSIPRRVAMNDGTAFLGVKHGPDLMATYGRDGRLISIFDSAREVDLIVPGGADVRPVTESDLREAIAVNFDDCELDGVTYFIGGDVGAIKIGRTTNLPTRLKDIQACSPIPLRVLATRTGGERERLYHDLYKESRLHGEWFDRHPDLLAEIARLASPTLQIGDGE